MHRIIEMALQNSGVTNIIL